MVKLCLGSTKKKSKVSKLIIDATIDGTVPKKRALAITIGDSRQPQECSRNQQICDQLSGVESTFIRFQEKTTPQGNNSGELDIGYLRAELAHLL